MDCQIRLIDPNHEDQSGMMAVSEAMVLAKEQGLDLVVVAERADPPVCRFMNFGKYIYEKNKQVRDQKKKHVKQKSKEIKFHPNIDQHDYMIKLNHMRKFLEHGCRVKVSLFFRGREMKNKEKGMALMERVRDHINDIGVVDSEPRLVGRNISMQIVPLSNK